MDFALLAFDDLRTVVFSTQASGLILAFLYLVLIVWLFVNNRKEWHSWSLVRWTALALVIILGVIGSGLFLIYLPGPEILPLPNLPDIPDVPAVPLFGALLVFVAVVGLGVGPAILVGGAVGWAHALMLTGRGSQFLEYALVAAFVGFLLRQNYQGPAFRRLRHPILAAAIGGLVTSIVTFPFLLTATGPETPILSAVDFAWSHTRAAALPNLLEWVLAGSVIEFAFYLSPSLRPRPVRLVPPPYEYSITRRFLYVLVPCFVLTIVGLLVVVTSIAINSATDLALKQMSHDASVASDAIPDLNLISINLLTQFAENPVWLDGGPQERQTVADEFFSIDRILRTTAYFRQLVVFDGEGEIVQNFPTNSIPLRDDEIMRARRAAIDGQPSTDQIWVVESEGPMLSHVVSIRGEGANSIGALLGRVDLKVALAPIVRSLQGTVGAGRGFIVDGFGTTIAHSNQDRVGQPWTPDQDPVEEMSDRLADDDIGHAYEGVGYNGMRQLVYHRQGPDHPWMVVIIVPYERVLSLAAEVAGPLAIFLGVAGLLLAAVLALLISRLTHPLSLLSDAASAIARQDLDTPIHVSGEDQVGELGRAFEGMRRALRDRLGELQLLLGVSQGVAASLDLARGLPPILDGALEATGADGVRIVTNSSYFPSPAIAAKGDLGTAMAPLDTAIARFVQRDSSLRIDSTRRMRLLPGLDRLADKVGAIFALPLTTSQGFQGVFWIAFREPHIFTESEIGFMTTLAGQASLLVENVQLFESAEGGRRRLAAILSSTSDAVIVTDQQSCILLLNPAAEKDFGLSASQVVGQPVASVISDSGLADLLSSGSSQDLSREVELPGRRVLYARSSSISGDNGQVGGRVTVLRDITHLKELDEMKTEFVSTVSHDLRSPLTYMRGYVTMLPMIGELNNKQKDYVTKILSGIDQMTRLVVDLLSLARIESDVDQLVEDVDLGNLVRGVARSFQTHAASKGLKLNVEVAENLPAVTGNPTLLRQAASNLLDNAIKYTPSGQITARVHQGEGHLILQVQDTGPGISQADQVRLFERFYRVRRRDTGDIKGTGLGLAIVKSIIERRHNGRVWVESRLGAGSSFFAILPLEQPSGNGT